MPDVKLFLLEEIIHKINIREQSDINAEIYRDLNTCTEGVDSEDFRCVIFEQNDEEDFEYQQATSLSQRPQMNPDHLSFWKPGQIRLFISHRDKHKAAAKSLAEALEEYGISAFVAHDTIEPLEEWQHTIRKGLETMEVMLAFITDDFHDSEWTNQEIGFALGSDIPVISLKVQHSDPQGFLGTTQALRGKIDAVPACIPQVYQLLANKLGNADRLQSALISAFTQAPDFSEAKRRFDRMDHVITRLTDEEVDQIISGFEKNNQLYNAIYLIIKYARLQSFLNRTTEKRYVVADHRIRLVEEESDDAIPF